MVGTSVRTDFTHSSVPAFNPDSPIVNGTGTLTGLDGANNYAVAIFAGVVQVVGSQISLVATSSLGNRLYDKLGADFKRF